MNLWEWSKELLLRASVRCQRTLAFRFGNEAAHLIAELNADMGHPKTSRRNTSFRIRRALLTAPSSMLSILNRPQRDFTTLELSRIEAGTNAAADWTLVMTDSERQFQRAKARLLAGERKLIQLLSANPFLQEIQEVRERILERIENDDSTIIQRELTFSFAINMVSSRADGLVLSQILSQIRDQDRRCAPLRDEWHALLRLRNGYSD